MNVCEPSLPGGYTIFCDDIREERDGKRTLVGTYTGEMTVHGEMPRRIPQLCALINFQDDPASLPKAITIRIVREENLEETEKLFEVSIDLAAPPQEFWDKPIQEGNRKIVSMQIAAKFSHIEFPNPCRIRARAYFADTEVRLGTLEVRVSDVPPQLQTSDNAA